MQPGTTYSVSPEMHAWVCLAFHSYIADSNEFYAIDLIISIKVVLGMIAPAQWK